MASVCSPGQRPYSNICLNFSWLFTTNKNLFCFSILSGKATPETSWTAILEHYSGYRYPDIETVVYTLAALIVEIHGASKQKEKNVSSI